MRYRKARFKSRKKRGGKRSQKKRDYNINKFRLARGGIRI